MTAPHLPDAFLARMKTLLGDAYEAFWISLQQPPARGLRVNTLKITPEAFQQRAPFPLAPLPWLPEGFLVTDDTARPGRHPYHAAGLYYLQDPSAMLAAHLLDPQPGQWVLDVSAAPGGKSTHLAARLQGQGLLVANDIIRHRTRSLIDNLERFGIANLLVTSHSVEDLARAWPGRFHRVLVDAPCSGEGMFRKSPAARQHWSPSLIQGNARRQIHILTQAAQTVAPGGRLLYATCTFAPEENERVIAQFLRDHPHFHLVEPARLPGMDEGHRAWGRAPDLPLERCVRIWPHRSPGDGHFFALMEREGLSTATTPLQPPPSQLPSSSQQLLQTFWEQTLTLPWPRAGLVQYGDWLHLLPVAPDAWHPLRPIRAGLRLGRIQRGRFQPHHALALFLRDHHAHQTLTLAPDAPETLAWLRGETLPSPGPDGWVLVTVEGYPLGWGRRARGILKNHIPRGLRWT